MEANNMLMSLVYKPRVCLRTGSLLHKSDPIGTKTLVRTSLGLQCLQLHAIFFNQGAFDLLSEDFNRPFLAATVSGVIVLLGLTRGWSRQKRLSMLWM